MPQGSLQLSCMRCLEKIVQDIRTEAFQAAADVCAEEQRSVLEGLANGTGATYTWLQTAEKLKRLIEALGSIPPKQETPVESPKPLRPQHRTMDL
jgi:hypothetical protein